MGKGVSVDSSAAWNNEYERQGIPSSHRDEPSGVLRWAMANVPFLTDDAIESAVDLGCGTGRNAVALVEADVKRVNAIDFSETALGIARKRRGAESITFTHSDVTKPLPFADNSFEFASDVFVYFHQIDDESRIRYRQEISRILKPGGILLISLATDNDGYYSSCPIGSLVDVESSVRLAWDPIAEVGNILLSYDQLVKEFSDLFSLQMSWIKQKPGTMHGKIYIRETAATLWVVN